MAKEKKLAVTLRGQSLPNVYSTDALKLGETGAIIVYNHPVTTQVEEDGKLVDKTDYQTDSVAIRFSLADDPISADVQRKLGAAVNAIIAAYLGADTDYSIENIIVGKLGYQWEYHKGMGIAIAKITVGDMEVSQAHYLGSVPTVDSKPSQQTWAFNPAPAALQTTVAAALPTIIKAELYGG